MGMQHRTAAPQIIANTILGGHPKTRAFSEPVRRKAIGWTTSGGRRKQNAASGITTRISATAYQSMVCRQPKLATARSKIGGQIVPATSETYTFTIIADDAVALYFRAAGATSWTPLYIDYAVGGGRTGQKSVTLTAGGFAVMPGKAIHWFSCEGKDPCLMVVTFDQKYDIVWVAAQRKHE